MKVLKMLFSFVKVELFRLKIIIVKLNNKNIKLGSNVKIDFNTNIFSCGNRISIGQNVYLRSKSKFYQAGMPFHTTILIDVQGAFVSIGNNTRINGAYIHAQRGITIGENCVIASGVNILDTNGHELISNNRTIGRDKPEEIILGDNVWIAVNVTILKGTTIGNNAVVGAGSVVKGCFPDNALIMGNPARLVKILEI